MRRGPASREARSTSPDDRSGRVTPLNRRTLLQAAGAGLVAVGTVPATSAAAEATGPTVYVGGEQGNDQDGALHAVDAESGDQIWEFDETREVYSSPTVVDGTVYVGDWSGTLYAVDAASGEEIWAEDLSAGKDGRFGGVLVSPTIVDDTVYAMGGRLYALDAETGRQEWEAPELEGDDMAEIEDPLVVDGSVYLSTADVVHCIDATSGELDWTFDGEWTDDEDVGVGDHGRPLVYDGTMYVCGELGSGVTAAGMGLFGVDADTGDREWAARITDSGWMARSRPTVVDGTMYLCDDSGGLYAVDPASGDEEWSIELGTSRLDQPAVIDGTLYVAGGPTVYAVDAADGSDEWEFPLPEDEARTPVTASDGTLYVGTHHPGSSGNGYVYAIDATDGSQEWVFESPWRAIPGAPTVVDDPEGGDSVDSRVIQAALGHHDAFTGADPVTSGGAAGAGSGDDSLPGPGLLGAVAAIGGVGYVLKRRLENGVHR